MALISKISAREVLDSRGYPTIEVEVVLEDGALGRASIPAGASTGKMEAMELRDGEKGRYLGKGVRRAVTIVTEVLALKLLGLEAHDQPLIDRTMIDLDGTPNKSRLGANSILGISLAVSKAAATSDGVPLFKYLGGPDAKVMPVPMMNVINGGRHADNTLDFQEFMIVPLGAPRFSDALRAAVETFHSLKEVLKSAGYGTTVGDEGGFAPRLRTHDEAIELILAAITKAGFKAPGEVAIALDPAASEFFYDGVYRFEKSDRSIRDAEGMVRLYDDLVRQYPIVSLEDGLAETDWRGWEILTRELGDRLQLVGDDIFVTNPALIAEGIRKKVATAVLIKLNQVGTVTETLQAVRVAQGAGYGVVISHRSGETEDTAIADFAVACQSGQIKAGSACRTDRVAKYNQLLRIEEQLGPEAVFLGPRIFSRYVA